MARETEPLLARRPSSNSSRNAEEEDALLSGQQPPQSKGFLSRFSSDQILQFRETFAFLWAFLATIIVIVLAVLLQHASHHPSRRNSPQEGPNRASQRPHGKRNLIFMVSDGMGPHSLSLTRSFEQYTTDAPFNHTLLLDSLLVGQSRTRSSDSLVTDSAAGATAFSCGEKSYNGAISILPDGTPCPSVMEAAHRAGFKTGVVVTTRVTDATPACFGSHVRRREMEDEIAVQMTGLEGLGSAKGRRSMDIILGGGKCHFIPGKVDGGIRNDSRDITDEAQKNGWHYVDSREGFDELKAGRSTLPLLGLFAPADIPFEIDRRHLTNIYPSLSELATFALRALEDATKDSDHGFFLMIEGSRIDHAGHLNDPAAQVHEVSAYDAAVSSVLDFIDSSKVPTLMVGTSDHETGGLALALQPERFVYPHYDWYPSTLAAATQSTEHVAHLFHQRLTNMATISSDVTAKPRLELYLSALVQENLGFTPTRTEIHDLIKWPVYAVWTLSDMLSLRAGIGWSTHGHSAADVNIYSSAATGRLGQDEEPEWAEGVRQRLAGNRENTDVGKFMRWWLDVEAETAAVGEELRRAVEGEGGEVEDVKAQMKGTGRTGGHAGFEHELEMEYNLWRDWRRRS